MDGRRKTSNKMRHVYLLAIIFGKGYTVPNIALEIRCYIFQSDFFKGRSCSTDKRFDKISAKLCQVKKDWEVEKIAKLKDEIEKSTGRDKRKLLNSKSLKINVRGRQPTDEE